MVTGTMNSDFLTQGPKIKDFENEIEQTLEVKHAVACSSGTSALHLAYSAAGITSKSLGIVPAITFAATANALRYQGAEVKFCDVDSTTGLICTDSLEEVIRKIPDSQKEELNIIAPVSFAGRVAPLPRCAEIAKANNFILIEDASHSPGAWVKKILVMINTLAQTESMPLHQHSAFTLLNIYVPEKVVRLLPIIRSWLKKPPDFVATASIDHTMTKMRCLGIMNRKI